MSKLSSPLPPHSATSCRSSSDSYRSSSGNAKDASPLVNELRKPGAGIFMASRFILVTAIQFPNDAAFVLHLSKARLCMCAFKCAYTLTRFVQCVSTIETPLMQRSSICDCVTAASPRAGPAQTCAIMRWACNNEYAFCNTPREKEDSAGLCLVSSKCLTIAVYHQ